MLRVQTQELDGALICRLEGRFTNEGAEEVRTLVTRCDSKLELLVDLTDADVYRRHRGRGAVVCQEARSSVRCRDFVFPGRLRTASAPIYWQA